MQLYDPTVTAPARGFARAPAIADLRGLTIGLLDNGKVNADNLLMRTAELFVERHGCSIAPMSDKHNASAPAPSAILETLAEKSDFLITAMGD